jgi:hypothetical protein
MNDDWVVGTDFKWTPDSQLLGNCTTLYVDTRKPPSQIFARITGFPQISGVNDEIQVSLVKVPVYSFKTWLERTQDSCIKTYDTDAVIFDIF